MENPTSKPFLIADTSALISLTSVTDRNHDAAVAASEALSAAQATILVPDAVFAETINLNTFAALTSIAEGEVVGEY